MKSLRYLLILLALLALLALPYAVGSEFLLNFFIMVLFYAFIGQSWNILAGYGGQFSFGHAAFFGTGAYSAAVAQASFALNPWLAFALSGLAGGAIGLVVGVLSFRFHLRGAYFALITLAFAEVLRILAGGLSITGGGVGILLDLDPGVANFQFAHPAGFYFVALALAVGGIGLSAWLERSAFGSTLIAVREDEDAAEALGVNAFAVKLRAIVLSSLLAGFAGGFYVQYFLYLDPSIAYGTAISVEALFTALVGGAGTLLGPLFGSVLLQSVGEAVRHLAGETPGVDLMVFGVLLILFVRYAPRGVAGLVSKLTARMERARR